MSSRNADAPTTTRWRSLLGGQSITTYIARLYALSAIVLLATILGLLQWAERQNLRAENAYFLSDKMQQLLLIIRQHPGDPTFIEQEVEVEGGAYAADLRYILYSRILDAHGSIVTETPGMDRLLPAEIFPPPRDYSGPQRSAERIRTNGRAYLLATSWSDADPRAPGRRIVQVALDSTNAEDFLTFYQRGAMLLVLVGSLVSAWVGVQVATHGMRPLAEIAQIADEITASRLHRRLHPERWPQELTSLAQAFDGMLTRIDDSHTRLAQFSADLAHELRTPINALMGQTHVALTRERDPEEYRQLLQSNLEEYQRLARMIGELLFLAQAEDPKTEIDCRWIDGRHELDIVREFHEALAEERKVTVSCAGHAGLYADPYLIRRAITNLLSNALRHTPAGGRIVLSVAPTDDGQAVFKVSDTGCGIRSEDLPRIFERFFGPNQGVPWEAEGTGLGLAIVKSIAELHGGTARAESIPGAGTTVSLQIPVPDDAAAVPIITKT